MTKHPLRLGLFVVLAVSTLAVMGCGGGSKRGAGEGTGSVEGGVMFRFYDQKATRVNVVGDFNDWSPRADAMVDENGDGLWTLFLDLRPGSYQYKFVINGTKWIPDPENPEKAPDGFGGDNSVVLVPGR